MADARRSEDAQRRPRSPSRASATSSTGSSRRTGCSGRSTRTRGASCARRSSRSRSRRNGAHPRGRPGRLPLPRRRRPAAGRHHRRRRRGDPARRDRPGRSRRRDGAHHQPAPDRDGLRAARHEPAPPLARRVHPARRGPPGVRPPDQHRDGRPPAAVTGARPAEHAGRQHRAAPARSRAVGARVRRPTRALARPAHRLGARRSTATRRRRGDELEALISPRWCSDLEAEHDVVIYYADPEPTPWTRACVRQADLLLLVADATTSPELCASSSGSRREPRVRADRIELVLVHPSWTEDPRGTSRLARAVHLHRHHHVRADRAATPTGSRGLSSAAARCRLQRRRRAGDRRARGAARAPRGRTSRSTPWAARASARSSPARPSSAMDIDATMLGLREALVDGKSPVDFTFPRSRSPRARVCRSACRPRPEASTSRTPGSTASASRRTSPAGRSRSTAPAPRGSACGELLDPGRLPADAHRRRRRPGRRRRARQHAGRDHAVAARRHQGDRGRRRQQARHPRRRAPGLRASSPAGAG